MSYLLVRKGEERLVNTVTNGSQTELNITHLADGGYIIVWTDESAEGNDTSLAGIKAQRFDADGDKVGFEFSVNTTTFGFQFRPSVVELASGKFVVTWTDTNALDTSFTNADVRGQVFNSDGTPSGLEFVVSTNNGGSQVGATVTALAGGGFVATWSDTSGVGGDASGRAIKAQLFDANGGKVGDEFLVNTVTEGSQSSVSVTSLAAGGFAVSWANGSTAISVQMFDAAGAKVGTEQAVNTGSTGSAGLASIAALDAGFVVTWGHFGGGPFSFEIKAQRFDANGAKVGGEILVNTDLPGHQSWSDVTGLPGGGFVVTWESSRQQQPFDSNVQAQVFDANGIPIGDEFTVSGVTAGFQTLPRITTLPSGEVIVTWIDTSGVGGDNSGSGIKMQLLAPWDNMPSPGDDLLIGTLGPDVIDGLGGDDEIGGLDGNDTLDGSEGDDTIYGGNGDDVIDGGDGFDTIYGEDGDDVIDGGAGEDSIYGDDGNDTLNAGGGTGGWLFGGLGDDTLTASGGSFNLFGGGDGTEDDGNDRLTLTQGGPNSWLMGDSGDDVIQASGFGGLIVDGGSGDDDITIQGFSAGTVLLGAGTDIARLPTGLFTIHLDRGRDTIVMTSTGNGFITIVGFVAGEEGDRLDLSIYGADPFGAGILVMDANNSSAVIDHPASGMRYVLSGVRAANLSAYNLGVPNAHYAPQDMILDDAFAAYPEIEWPGELVGADGNDVIRGHGGDDRLFGAGGNDRLDGSTGADLLSGGTGNDQLDGRQGADRMEGGAGDDLYYVDAAGDLVVELPGGGSDAVYATVGYALAAGQSVELLSTASHGSTAAIDLTGNNLANTLIGNAGANVLNGLAGADSLQGLGGNDVYHVDAATDQVSEAANQGNDAIYASASYVLRANQSVELLSTASHGSTAAINLTGNNLANTVIGNAGANVLNGGGGADSLQGLGGNDTYHVDLAADQVFEAAGQGADTVYASVSYTLGSGRSVETLSTASHGATTAIDLTGNNLANALIGNAGVNVLNGGAGIDSMQGLAGNDIYHVDTAADQVFEAAGQGVDTLYASASYVLRAGQSVEAVSTASHGASVAIDLTGNELANTIFGNAGVNRLDGKGGNDSLIGLGGADIFAFTTPLGAGNVDTVSGFQTGVDKIALDDAVFGLAPGALDPNAFATGPAAQDGTDRIVYNNANGLLFFDADGSGPGGAVLFARLDPGLALAASDFTVI